MKLINAIGYAVLGIAVMFVVNYVMDSFRSEEKKLGLERNLDNAISWGLGYGMGYSMFAPDA